MEPEKSIAAILCALGLLIAGAAQAQNSWVVGQSAPLSGSNAVFGRDILSLIHI